MGLGAQGSEHAKVRLRRSGRRRLLGVRARARVQVRGRGRARARARVGVRVGFRVRVSVQRRRLLGGLGVVGRVCGGDVALEQLEQQLLRVG